jgi:AcrR family transcriptional regulator
MAPVSERAARRPGGRANQKERTRQALLAATRTLLADGQAPTIARAAQRALVSEATAYRYYSDVQNLLRDAFQWPGLDGLLSELRAIPTVEARARRAAEAMTRLVLARQAQIRALIAMSYAPGGAEKGSATRPAFRLPLIDAVLEPAADRLDAGERRRLQFALSAVIGAEAVLSLKDAGGCADEEIVTTLGWTAFQLAKAALGGGPSPTAGERA